jgi:hypothetical protein
MTRKEDVAKGPDSVRGGVQRPLRAVDDVDGVELAFVDDGRTTVVLVAELLLLMTPYPPVVRTTCHEDLVAMR